jgi:hypothetical protein
MRTLSESAPSPEPQPSQIEDTRRKTHREPEARHDLCSMIGHPGTPPAGVTLLGIPRRQGRQPFLLP